MTTEILTALAGNAGAIILLGVMLMVIQPAMEKRHRREREAADRRHAETIERIVESGRLSREQVEASHKENTQALAAALDANTEVLRSHSRSCMLRTLTGSGMPTAEAMRETERQIPMGI